MDGCPTGNCLRSHVNITEVEASLSMVTKAGVPASKIFVGETSYGRSFRMARSGCTGPMCQFLGRNTTPRAKAGRCTGQGGIISNFEIDEIIAKGGAQSWHDAASNTDMLVYDTTEWVSYMTSTTKETRRQHWKGFNLGGTIDWAVDLQTSANSGGGLGGWPKVTNGQCKGSDCIGGKCVGPACISLGCDGPGCIGGLCTTPDCTPRACADRDCENGACTGSICKTRGCSGLDCGLDGKCIRSNCVSLGCSGKDCALDTGICSGTDCAKTACGGDSCQNGVCLRGSAACQGLGMQPWPASTAGRCNGPDCVGGLCIGIRCVSFGCLTSNSCVNGVCLDSSCTATACIGPGCIEGVCVKPGCKNTGCVGTDCDASGHCNGADCVAIGCAGNDCNEATGLCLGPSCTKQSCAGPDCTRGDCRGDHECIPFAGCAGNSCGGGTITTITTTGSNGQPTTYIATLVPTTTTDAAGHIITGTITNGPSTTSTDDPALITYTEFPPGITAISTSVTHNTHDNDGNPILGPWPLCWFCPPGSHGWKLPGFRPGVYPPGGPPTPMPLKFPTITIKPNGDPEYKRSECKTATVTDVTSWVEVVVDGSQTVTATSAYSTDSSTVKACSATPRTIKKYTTTVAHYCEPTSCGSACAAARKREVVSRDSSELEYMPALEYNSEASNVGLYKRREESPGRGDWGAWYRRLRDEPETDAINNYTDDDDVPTAFRNVMWGGDTRQSILVQQLTGCFALFCVSTKGAFVAHFWGKNSLHEPPEGIWHGPPAISSTFNRDVTDIISANVGTTTSPIQLPFNPSCHLMVGTRTSISGNDESDQATLVSDSEEPNIDLSAHRDKIVTQLRQLLPGFPVKIHTYKKQVKGEFQKDYGYGKAAVIYDNGLGDNTETTVSVYLQGLRVRLINIPNPGPAIPGSQPTPPAESGSPTTPTATPDPPTSPPVTNKPYYDCEGDPFCGMMPVKWCDKAVNNMERGPKMYTSDESIAKSGNCWANSEGHGCKVTVRGPDKEGYVCAITGDDLWGYYQDIRKIGGCGRCGTVHIGNGCMISVDIHHGCENRDSGLLSLPEELS